MTIQRAQVSLSMGAQENGLSLEGLAQRLEMLERENGRMRSENAELQFKVARLEGSVKHSESAPALSGSDRHPSEGPLAALEGRVSRRSLLSKAGAAAVAAGMLLNARQARADHYDPGIWVDFVHAHSTNGYAVYAESTDGIGVEALAPNGTGVVGQSGDPGYYGVHGKHIFTSGHGVVGDGKGADGVGVLGRNSTGVGVQGTGKNGVYGLSDTGDGWGAVVGRSTGQGGIGTYGECSGGTGVKGISTSGYAGEFVGGKAQLKLQPGGSAGKPTSGTHSTGEIYMDKAGTLFVCVASSTSTTAAKWMKVSTTAV